MSPQEEGKITVRQKWIIGFIMQCSLFTDLEREKMRQVLCDYSRMKAKRIIWQLCKEKEKRGGIVEWKYISFE